MSDDSLVAIITAVIVLIAGSIGIWLGLRLVRGSDLKNDPLRLNKITLGIWIAAALALGALLLSNGRLSFTHATFAFVGASIAIFAVFRRVKSS